MPRQILIADDSEIARKALQELLQKHGWEVCGAAENGSDAIRLTLELKPDVVILDLAMPSMDGLTAARKISESLPTVPIVMYTLHSLPQLELEAKKNGIRHVVPKSETIKIISVLEELTLAHDSVGSFEPVEGKESATVQSIQIPVNESVASIETTEVGLQKNTPDDIAKAG
jgi:DNA-binding NarL/FixJ family response regulator